MKNGPNFISSWSDCTSVHALWEMKLNTVQTRSTFHFLSLLKKNKGLRRYKVMYIAILIPTFQNWKLPKYLPIEKQSVKSRWMNVIEGNYKRERQSTVTVELLQQVRQPAWDLQSSCQTIPQHGEGGRPTIAEELMTMGGFWEGGQPCSVRVWLHVGPSH